MMEDAKVIAMDEPTSSLTPAEFERLAVLIAELAAQGVSIIYVSHKMDEVFRVCQTRHDPARRPHGRRCRPADTTESAGGRADGRPRAGARRAQGFATDEIVLEVAGLTRGTAVRDASFTLQQGEVLGIAGLVGAGRTELLRLIAGVDRPDAGEIRVEGQRLAARQPARRDRRRPRPGARGAQARRHHRAPLGHAPTSALPRMRRFSRLGFVRQRALARRERGADARGEPAAARRSSGRSASSRGGNQQKAIIGRWLAAGARILLFDEPTRGIDVGAKAEIYDLIERLAAEGRSMIVVSSELPEILRVSDRVLVMREGRIAGVLERDEPERRGDRRARRAAIARPPQRHPPSRGPEPCPAPTASPLQPHPAAAFALNVGLRDAGTLLGLLVDRGRLRGADARTS